MDQGTISSLLVQASQPDCSKERRQEIRNTLAEALPDATGDDTYAPGVLETFENLFNQCLREPEKFIDNYGAFAMMCGDRPENKLFAEVEWLRAPRRRI